jgi:hypothetical protein
MGLPEYFSGLETQSSHIPEIIKPSSRNTPIALIVPATDDQYRLSPTASSGQRLGSQYFLGVFPLTGLYLQHDLDSLLIEKTISQLQALGYRSYIVNRRHLSAVSASLSPAISIAPTLDISLNAYDAFFFRILSAQGNLKIDYLAPTGRVMHTENLAINKRQYRRTGFAPALSRVLENSLVESLGETLSRERSHYLPRARANAQFDTPTDSPSPLLLLPVSLDQKLATKINNLIGSSYGFKHSPAISSGATRRLIQRGLEYSASSSELPVAAEIPPLASQPEKVLPRNVHLWYLSSTVEQLSTGPSGQHPENIQMSMLLTLHEQAPPNTQRIISLKRCQVSFPVVRGVDGYWAVTLERASAEIGKQFFNPHSSTTNKTNCEDLPQ